MNNLLAFIKKNKIAVIVSGSSVLLILILIIVVALFNSAKSKQENNIKNKVAELRLADDSTSALATATQPYNRTDNTPGITVYSETGFPAEIQYVKYNPDFSLNAKPCGYLEDQCVKFGGKEKTTIPNHALLQMYNGVYKDADNKAVNLSAYAILPDGSMVTMSNDAQFQFNFYNNETRVVQLSGEAYYRIKKQPEDKKFTAQIGNQIFTADNTEFSTTIIKDDIANKNNLKALNDLAIEEKNNGKMDLEKEAQLKAYHYIVDTFVNSGSVTVSERGSATKSVTILDNTNPYLMFNFQDYGNRTRYASRQTEIDNAMVQFTNAYFSRQLSFSMNTYGLGGFNDASLDQIYNALLYSFDGVTTNAYNGYLKYQQETAEFNTEWNNLMNKMSNCEDGWYKVANNKCCPNGSTYNSSDNTCFTTVYKTVTRLSCNSGYYLGSDNMCHKNGSNAPTATPYYSNASGKDSSCVNPGTAAYQLCRMDIGISGTAYMSGSKCCMTANVPEPNLQPVK